MHIHTHAGIHGLSCAKSVIDSSERKLNDSWSFEFCVNSTHTYMHAHSHTQKDAVYFCDLDIEEAKAKARAVVAIP